jgi:Actinobacteria/chloroflexi VLRF1 release factor
VVSGPARGGGRWVEVDPDRLARWLAGFAERHGGYAPTAADNVRTGDGDTLTVCGADGATAELHPPPGVAPADVEGLVATAGAPRRIGLLLVRRGGYGVGVAEGAELTASKVDSRYVQSRTAAGGWSQQRFARRRDNQARAVAGAAAEVAVRLLLPEAGRLAALVAGGDRRLADEALADARLAPLRPLRAGRFLDVPDPRLAVLQAAVRAARTVRIRVVEPC